MAWGESLWLDELHTSWTVAGTWDEIGDRARLGNNGPLYFYLVRGVTWCLGMTESSLRGTSLVSGIGLIVGTYLLARRWECTQVAALLAAALVAMDRQSVFYSTEARTYGLVQFVALLHLWLFVSLLTQTNSSRVWVSWVLTGVLLFHLHCTCALILLAQVVAYGLLRLMRYQLMLKPSVLAVSGAVWGVGALPAWGLVEQLADRRENWELFVPRAQFADVFSIYPLHLYVLAPVIFILASHWWFRRRPDEVETPRTARTQTLAILVCATWLLVPLLVAWSLTYADVARLFFRRYVIASSVSLALLTSLTLSRFLPSSRGGFAGALLIGGLAVFQTSAAYRGENWRDAIAHVNQTTVSTPLLFCSGLIETNAMYQTNDPLERAYCEFPLRGLYALHPRRSIWLIPTTSSFSLSTRELEQLAEGGILLVRGRQRFEQVKQHLDDACPGRLSYGVQRTFGRVVVVTVRHDW